MPKKPNKKNKQLRRCILDQTPRRIKRRIFEFLDDDFTIKGKSWTITLTQKAITFEAEKTKVYAESNFSACTIMLNPYENSVIDLLNTVVHEFLHVLAGWAWHSQFKTASESEAIINRVTKEVLKVLSPLEISAVLAKVFAVAIWDE